MKQLRESHCGSEHSSLYRIEESNSCKPITKGYIAQHDSAGEEQ